MEASSRQRSCTTSWRGRSRCAARGAENPSCLSVVCSLTTLAAGSALLAHGCVDPERERLKNTTRALYDKVTGKLTELTYDANKNGRIDTWTEMDGTRPLRSRIDANEDGRVDRWEYYDQAGRLSRVGFSRSLKDQPDAWAYSTRRAASIGSRCRRPRTRHGSNRWEFYDTNPGPDGAGPLLRVEEDTNHDGRPDKWERYAEGTVETAEFDEDRDGRPDRRLTYKDAALVLIESAPDTSGRYTRSLTPK